MHAEFWHERWKKDEIGFHQTEINAHLRRFTGMLGLEPGAHILVPLCGKSLDMLWLARQGYMITGIELSERAARDFFTENALDYEMINNGDANIYRGKNIEIRCMDFFTTTASNLPKVDGVYDRAALIALPPNMRSAYASRLAGLVGEGVPCLLITLEYPQNEMNGPPFSVESGEVEDLFCCEFKVRRLLAEERLAKEPRFRKKGLTRLDEHVYLLRRKSDGPCAEK